jgi:hypothetical protein
MKCAKGEEPCPCGSECRTCWPDPVTIYGTKAFTNALRDVADEHQRAINKFRAFNSPHEGIAIIEEEFLELREEVFKQHDARTKEKMRAEAKQIAAMALRFMIDLTS